MQIVSRNRGAALTDWYQEVATIENSGANRLSGMGMRKRLYFGTAPGNDALFVSQGKTLLGRLLPVVGNIPAP